MNIQEQKDKVLKMLADDVITQEQALDLLELISMEIPKEEQEEPIFNEPIQINIPESPFDFFRGGHQTFSLSGPVNSNVIESLRLVGKNSKVSIKTHKKDKIDIKGWYKAIRNTDPMISFDKEGDNYALNFNYHGVKYLGFEARVPEKMIELFSLETSNAEIDVVGLLAEDILLETKNASIFLDKTQGERIVGSTKNSPFIIRDVDAKRVEFSTTNAKIEVNRLNSYDGSLVTTNAEISVKDSCLQKSYLQTKNAMIWYDLANLELNEQTNHYEMEGRTTNGGIEILLPEKEELPFKLTGSTKRGSVQTEGCSLVTIAKDKGYLNAKTPTYDDAKVSLDLNLQTTNGDIWIKDRSISDF